jgi:hypothetical protein
MRIGIGREILERGNGGLGKKEEKTEEERKRLKE